MKVKQKKAIAKMIFAASMLTLVGTSIYTECTDSIINIIPNVIFIALIGITAFVSGAISGVLDV